MKQLRFDLAPDAVDLWILRQEDVEGDTELDRCRTFLTDEERAKECQFRFPVDRHLYVLTRAFVRVVLGRYLSVSPHDLIFRPNVFGRPQLLSPAPCGSSISFNLSHTAGLVFLGVSSDREIGVDVERLDRNDLTEIAGTFLAPHEIIALERLPAVARQKRLLECWTLKEAYTKARSMGLSLPFQQFAFEFVGTSKLTFSTEAILADPSERWGFWQFPVGYKFLAAICAEVHPAGPPLIKASRLTPLLDFTEPIEISHVRSTDTHFIRQRS
jgi:4'-phosphopantetheinyl transferase